jgi:MtN3 and saliva related transmembrane protein
MPSELLMQVIFDGIFVTVVGSLAAALTTGSFVPQLVRALRTKRMHDVSPYLMALFASGTTLWLAYGIFREDWVIIGANTTGTALNLALLYLKYHYRRSS